MKWLKKAISLTVATAIMAAATDVSNVMAAENTYEGVVLSADEVSEESDFVIEDGVLKKYLGSGGDVVIPEGVVRIGSSAFAGCSDLESIELPFGLKTIGSLAFLRCYKLNSIKLPPDLTSIEGYAFAECHALDSIEIPSSVTSIGSNAFAWFRGIGFPQDNGTLPIVMFCEKGSYAESYAKEEGISYKYTDDEMKYFVIEDGVLLKYLGADKDVVIPEGVVSIGNSAFAGCSSLENIEIPSSVTSISYSAFEGTKWLENKRKEKPLVIVNGILIDGKTCSGDVVIPEGVTSIENYAFAHCDSISSVEIPSGVTEIKPYAFYNCSNLSDIEIPSSVTNVVYSAFEGTKWLENKRKENPLVIVNGNLIDGRTCSGDVVIPEDVTRIENGSFLHCDNLIHIELPSGIKNIEANVFGGCSNLTSIKIPLGVTSIGNGAFGYCSSLVNIEIPSSVVNIGRDAFEGTKWMENKRKENPLVIVNGILIDGKTCSGDVVIPEGVTCIAGYAFYNCSNLSSVELPFGVVMIGDSAFASCHNLNSIKLPSSVTSIENNAFIYCWCITKIHIYCAKGSYPEIFAKENNISYSYIEEVTSSEPRASVTPSPSAAPSPVSSQQKAQTIIAKNITKVYGDKSFTIGAKTDGNGILNYISSDKKVAVVSGNGKITIKGCGKTTITIKAAETKEYKAAEKKVTITVKPAKQKVSSVKAGKSKNITVKWKKDTKATGYILQYSTDKNFNKNVKNITISNNKTISKKISKLTPGKKYYVRVCSYKKVSGTKLKGSYSTVKSVTVNK